MFHKKSLLLILLAAFTLLAAPAFAQDRVDKLVIRNNLKNGRQFEAVFQPGIYVAVPLTHGHPYATMDIRVISNPSDACFVRGEANSPYLLGHLDPDVVDPQDVWRFFELRDTCYLRFELENYYQGAVNIRRVKKFKIIELTDQWKQVKFGAGRWTASGHANYFRAQYKFDANSGCREHRGKNGRRYGFDYKSQGTITGTWSFILEKPCVVQMRAVEYRTDDDGNSELVPVPQETVAFAKSN